MSESSDVSAMPLAASSMSAPVIPDLRPWFVTCDDLPAPPLKWSAFFGNGAPVELEVGTGRGLFLVNAATTQPAVNFVGIEYDFKEGRRAARRLKKRALPNARIIGADANLVLAKYVTDASVAAVHVYFPDPWWKRRHRKRRIWNPAFVDQMARIVRPGGLLHAWTDVEEYFGVIVELVDGHAAFTRLAAPSERPATHDMDYHTSFERKKRQAGCTIFRACWQRMP